MITGLKSQHRSSNQTQGFLLNCLKTSVVWIWRSPLLGTERQSVTLTCTYQTSYRQIYLHWYRHQSEQAPQFILLKGAKGNTYEHIPNNRYGSRTSDSSTELTITGLTLADTALYYCALDTQKSTREALGIDVFNGNTRPGCSGKFVKKFNKHSDPMSLSWFC
uniref:Ig-like domain-containing protein n=1 Tax=Myripristis murdjan TaxID=586833 RepID=A0A667WQR7_9TELE